MKHNYANQINALWITFLLGTLFHTQLGLMPLFHGKSVADVHNTGEISWIFWLMLLFFVLPMLAIILTAFTENRRYKIIHFWGTIVYSVLNLLHLMMDLMLTPIIWYQITLMIILFFIGLVLNLVSYQWLKDNPHKKVILAH